MPLGKRQLFIYWRVAARDLPTSLHVVREWQAGLIAQHPTLRCGLYQRVDAAQTDATVMESYAIESAQPHRGIDEALLQLIAQGGQAQLAQWLRGARHVELFDALPS